MGKGSNRAIQKQLNCMKKLLLCLVSYWATWTAKESSRIWANPSTISRKQLNQLKWEDILIDSESIISVNSYHDILIFSKIWKYQIFNWISEIPNFMFFGYIKLFWRFFKKDLKKYIFDFNIRKLAFVLFQEDHAKLCYN